MNIRGLPREVRQSTKMLGQPQKLIFAYPMLIDESLIQLSELIRNFVAISFIGEIRISNILNVSTKYLSPSPNSTNINQLTPAERLYNNLEPEGNRNKQYSNDDMSDYNRSSQMRYGHYMNDFIRNELITIKQHIKNNTRYSKLKPSVSILTIIGDEFVNIPLIIGSKMYPVNSANLYWILLIAIGFNIHLSDSSNISKIINIIKNINPDYFYSLIFTQSGRDILINRIKSSRNSTTEYSHKQTSTLLNSVFGGMKQTSAFFNAVLNPIRWDMYNGLTSYANPSAMFATSRTTVSPQLSKIMIEADQLFYTFISNEVVNLIHSYSNLFEPKIATPTIVISNYIEALKRNIPKYDDISNLIYAELQNSLTPDIQESLNINPGKVASTAVNRISEICHAINKMDVLTIFKKLTNCPVVFSHMQFHTFIDNAKYVSSSFDTLSKTLENSLISMSGTKAVELDRLLINCKNSIKNAARVLIHEQTGSHGSLFEPVSNISNNPHEQFASIHGHDPFNTANIDDLYENLKQSADDSVEIITNIVYFLYLYTYMSFICKSINILEMEINVMRKDATDFPNYILVIPMPIMITLYSIIDIRNFKGILKSKEEQQKIFDKTNEWSPNQTQLQKMIAYIKQVLRIPNIIVIDKQTKELYYNFMYMRDTAKIKLMSVQTYIKNQANILSV